VGNILLLLPCVLLTVFLVLGFQRARRDIVSTLVGAILLVGFVIGLLVSLLLHFAGEPWFSE